MFPYNNSCHVVSFDLLLFSLFSDHKGKKKKIKYYSELAKLFTSDSESIMTAKIITILLSFCPFHFFFFTVLNLLDILYSCLLSGK